jgi:hypothetical protein
MGQSTVKTPSQLRRFGLVMTVPFGLMAAALAWKGREWWPVLAGVAAAFALLGLLMPRALRPVERAWMRFALALSRVTTAVLLTLAFVLVITPLGLLLRVLGKRPLRLGFDKAAATYWRPVEPNGPASRPNVPY